HLGNDALAVLVEGARADGDDFAFLRLFLRGVGDDDAAGGLLILLDAADDHAVAERTEFHWGLPPQEGCVFSSTWVLAGDTAPAWQHSLAGSASHWPGI